MDDADELSRMQAQVEALNYENAKLKKINQVLMQRVELGWGNHSVAYRSFESAALLADKVKERTSQLQRTLSRLEETNQRLGLAQRASEMSRQMLLDAIESIPDSFVMFDEHRILVLANTRFWDFWEDEDVDFVIGKTRLVDIQETARRLGLIDERAHTRDVSQLQGEDQTEVVLRLRNGRWIKMTEHPTAENGLVIIYTDITAVKETEELRRERALAEQNLLMQSTLENMSQGVALFNVNRELETWNRQFVELCGLDNDSLERGLSFDALMAGSTVTSLPSVFPSMRPPGEVVFVHECTLPNDAVIVARRHAIPGGGFLDTYSDITDRSRNEEALRESERRIRLITDAMPAMIAYVNKNLCYEFVNSFFEQWFHRPRNEILGKSLLELLGNRDYQIHRPYIEGALSGRSVSFEVTQTSGDGIARNFRKTFIPHFDSDATVIGFFALEQDITEQRRTAQALQQAYEHMEQRVSARTREISEINTQLRNEITERHQIEASLIEAKKEADDANESKTRFLAAASHDLLQPMNAARLFATALRDQHLSSQAENLVSSLTYSLENVESLINSLVDISKLEAGVVEAVADSFCVDDLLSKLAEEYSPQADGEGLALTYVKSSAIVHSDSQLLARILRNLLSNAIRYTQSGQLVLGCRRRKAGLEIQVWDTGVGIPADKRQEIFREFSRIEARQRRSDKGLGLGLAIVDRIARVLGHDVFLHSTPGKGSCFSVVIPYGRVEKQPSVSSLTLDSLALPMAGADILVIDNDPDICEGMRAMLETWQCRVTTVQTLEELRHLIEARDYHPRLVLADYHLDDDDTGLDAIDIISVLLPYLPPVVMITADYSNELRQTAKERGFTLMNKPVKPLKLKVLISKLLTDTDESESVLSAMAPLS